MALGERLKAFGRHRWQMIGPNLAVSITLMLASNAVAAFAEWLGSGPFIIDTNIVYVPAPADQKWPAIGFDGNSYFAVWQDERSGTGWDIYGSRVTQAGVVLDPASTVVSSSTDNQYYPDIAFGGTNYLVVWEDRRNGPADIYGARVTQDGVVLDSAGIAISVAPNGQCYPTVAFDGANYLVVWQDTRRGGANDIYGARVSQAGVVHDTAGFIICSAVNEQRYPQVTFGDMNCLVVWEDLRNVNATDIYGARVSRAGTVLDPGGIGVSTAGSYQQFPSGVFNGTDYFVVWYDLRNGGPGNLYGARVTRTGEVIDTAGIAITRGSNEKYYPSIAFSGTDYLVTWAHWQSGTSSDIFGARVTKDGVALDSFGIPVSVLPNDQWLPSVAFDGTNYFVIWQDLRSGKFNDVYGARVNRSGVVVDSAGFNLSASVNEQTSPSVAFDGTSYLAVWRDYRTDSDIYGLRVGQNGLLLDTLGFAISAAADTQCHPSAAFDGVNYLVVWEDRRSISYADIYGARVSRDGVVLDPWGLAISTATGNQCAPALTFDGTDYLVVWEDYRRDPNADVFGARVSREGTVLDPAGIAITTAVNDQRAPALVFDDANYFVVWDDGRGGPDEIYGARVSQGGIVLDTAGINISNAPNYQWSPAIAFDGSNYLVVWRDHRAGCDIYASRVSRTGIVLDPSGIAVSTASNSQWDPSVAFDGTNYEVVWQDCRSGSSWDIYGAKVTAAGLLADSFAVAVQSGNQVSPDIAHGSGVQALVVYSGWCHAINDRPANAMRIWGRCAPFLGVEEQQVSDVRSKFPNLSVYPNPCRNVFTIRLQNRIARSQPGQLMLRIYDACGKLTKEETLEDFKREARISLQGMSAGVYFIRAKVEEKELIEKIVVTR